MAGRTPQEALNTFVHPLQRALSTVSDGILLTSGVRNPPALHMLRLAQPTQRLHASAVLAMSFVCDYQILETGEPGGPWSVRGLATAANCAMLNTKSLPTIGIPSLSETWCFRTSISARAQALPTST